MSCQIPFAKLNPRATSIISSASFCQTHVNSRQESGKASVMNPIQRSACGHRPGRPKLTPGHSSTHSQSYERLFEMPQTCATYCRHKVPLYARTAAGATQIDYQTFTRCLPQLHLEQVPFLREDANEYWERIVWECGRTLLWTTNRLMQAFLIARVAAAQQVSGRRRWRNEKDDVGPPRDRHRGGHAFAARLCAASGRPWEAGHRFKGMPRRLSASSQ